MRELVGDAGRDDEWVWLRLTVSAQRIVDAAGEGPGTRELARSLRGLTLLEAAAVPGERLAADALAESRSAQWSRLSRRPLASPSR